MEERIYDFEELEEILNLYFSPPQREWFARLMHDHISNPIATMGMQIEVIYKMINRGMDISDELEELKRNVSRTSKHIVEIEKVMRPKTDDANF